MTDKIGFEAKRKMISIKIHDSKVQILRKTAILNMYASII